MGKDKITYTIPVTGLVETFLIVLAVLINFTNAIDQSRFPSIWLWNMLEGWSAIPFIIFCPILIALAICLVVLAAIAIFTVIVFIGNFIWKLFIR